MCSSSSSSTPEAHGVVDLDHVAVAVHDVEPVLDVLVDRLGGTVILGERVPGFQYALVRLGDAEAGMNLEVLQPWHPEEDDFLARFLQSHGEGPHHLSFVMRDLRPMLARLDEAGIEPVRVNLDWAPWQEAFVLPCQGHGTVVQVAGSRPGYAPMADMLAAAVEHRALPGPCQVNGTDRDWWFGRTPSGPPALLQRVVLGTRDLPGARRLFGDLLGGTPTGRGDGWQEYRWPKGGRLLLTAAEQDGIQRLDVRGAGVPATLAGAALHADDRA